MKIRREGMVSLRRLRSLLSYDEGTGEFYWRVSNPSKAKGERAGHTCTIHGYVIIGIDGAAYRAHRLAWFYVHGRWPKEQIDHRNHDKADNRIANLRECDHAGQCRNRLATRGRVLPKGVTQRPGYNRFRARISVDGVLIYLGDFSTPDAAYDCYVQAARQHFGEFAHT